MLTIEVVMEEAYNEEKKEFVVLHSETLEIEHSLASLSLWESKWKKPFLSEENKTSEELLDYVRCMVTNDYSEETIQNLSQKNVSDISEYINERRSATWFSEDEKDTNKNPFHKEIVTSELVYYWMVTLQIPFECQHWNLSRLMTLIQVCNLKNQPESNKKMSRRELLERNRALNAARRKKLDTKG